MKLKVGHTYRFKEKPSLRIAVFGRMVAVSGVRVWIASVDFPGNAYFFREDSLHVVECDDLNSQVEGIISMLDDDRIPLDEAQRVVCDQFGVCFDTSSTSVFISKLRNMIAQGLNDQQVEQYGFYYTRNKV